MLPYELVGIAQQWPYMHRMGLIFAHSIFSPILLHNRRHLKPGLPRLPAALLVVVLNFLTPALFLPVEEVVSLALLGLQFMWLNTFKTLGWAVGRGPLVEPWLTLPQFIAVASLPITPVLTTPAEKGPTKSGNARQAEPGLGFTAGAVVLSIQAVVMAVILTMLQSPTLPRLVREVLYAVGLYIFIALTMNGMGVVSMGLLGLKVAPHFDRPFLSSSLTDYWSRRWNLNTGYTMRFMVYDPIIAGRLVKQQGAEEEDNIAKFSFKRRAAALCASFACSGFMHELFIIYLRGRASGYWMAFFTVQGPLIVAESMMRRQLRQRGLAMPAIMAVPLTLSLLLLLGDALFFPDIVRMGIPDQVVNNLYELIPSMLR